MVNLLTDRCAENFTKWLENRYDETYHVYFSNWSEFPFSYQQGVYLEFFDSIGIIIDCMFTLDNKYLFKVTHVTDQEQLYTYIEEESKERWKGFKLAISAANKIYNEHTN